MTPERLFDNGDPAPLRERDLDPDPEQAFGTSVAEITWTAAAGHGSRTSSCGSTGSRVTLTRSTT